MALGYQSSTDLINFLFSLEDNKNIKEKHLDIDFGKKLSDDDDFKIIFLLFYTSIVYHVAELMKLKGIEHPRNIVFSGTGSRALKIVEEEGIEQDIVDLAIITMISRELRPSYPQSAAMIAFRRSLYHISDEFREMRRNFILETQSSDMKIAASQMLKSLSEQMALVVISGNEVLEKEKGSTIVKEHQAKSLTL